MMSKVISRKLHDTGDFEYLIEIGSGKELTVFEDLAGDISVYDFSDNPHVNDFVVTEVEQMIWEYKATRILKLIALLITGSAITYWGFTWL